MTGGPVGGRVFMLTDIFARHRAPRSVPEVARLDGEPHTQTCGHVRSSGDRVHAGLVGESGAGADGLAVRAGSFVDVKGRLRTTWSVQRRDC